MEPISLPAVPLLKRRRWLRRLWWWLFFPIIILLLLLVLTAAFFDRQISRQLIAELNKELKTELSIGDASLSLISGFPDAAVNLQNVRLKDAFGGYLLAAKELSFRFDLPSLFSDNIRVRALCLRDGAVRVMVNKQGKSNADIFKKDSRSAGNDADSKLHLALDQASFQNISVLYENLPAKQSLELSLAQANSNGNFSEERFRMVSTANMTIKHFDSDGSRYLSSAPLAYDAVLAVDLKKGIYGLQNVTLVIGGNTFSVSGLAVEKPKATELNLELSSQEGDISMIANLLPGAYREYFRTFQSSGQYTCKGTVKGRLSAKETPMVLFEVALQNGKVLSEKLQSPVRNVSFKARYHALPDGSGDFELADFKGNFGGHPLNFSLKISQLSDPLVDFRANGTLPLDAAYGLLDNELVTEGDGLVRLNHLSVQGRYADMVSMNKVEEVSASGELAFEGAFLRYNKVPILAETGLLRLQGNEFRLDSLRLNIGKSDLALDGSAQNLLPVLFSDSLNANGSLLEFEAALRSKFLDVSQLLELFRVQTTEHEAGGPMQLDSLKKEKNTARSLQMDRLKGRFVADIAQFQYGKIEGRNFAGSLELDHNNLKIKGNSVAMQGNLSLDGDAQFAGETMLKMRILAQDLDLTTMMAQCENFGQTVITDQNLKGKLSGRVVLWAYWDEAGAFDMKRLRALADVRAAQGELVGVKMFEDFSTFVHIEDLRRVKFTDLQNFIEIRDQRIYLPVMLIRSNALNLTLSGEHTFDNDIDYKIKVNAGQVLLNRIKKHDTDLDPLPEKDGWFNLYYTISGNLDKYEMKRRKRTVKAEFERSEGRKFLISKGLGLEF